MVKLLGHSVKYMLVNCVRLLCEPMENGSTCICPAILICHTYVPLFMMCLTYNDV